MDIYKSKKHSEIQNNISRTEAERNASREKMQMHGRAAMQISKDNQILQSSHRKLLGFTREDSKEMKAVKA